MPYKRNGKWLGQIRLNNQTLRKTFPTKEQAKEWEVNQKKKLKKQPEFETPSTCLLDWATDYLKYSQDKFVHKTWDEKVSMFKRFFKVVDHSLSFNDLTPGIVLTYLQNEYRSRSGYAANKDRKNLIAAWNWGIKYLGLPSPNPCLVDRFPEKRQIRYVPPEKDFFEVFDVAESEQDSVMLLAFLHLAARKGEIFGLRWEDIDFAEQRVRIYTRKRKDGTLEYDWLPMTDELYYALLEHRQQSVNEWVFPNPKTGIPYEDRNKWMGRLCVKAGVKKFGLHAIRHLTASILANNDAKLIDIQTLLRHKKLATTERYIRRLTSLRPVLRLLPSKAIKSHQGEPPKTKKGLTISG